ncbi:MAG: sulfatase activating formylglycine-generating enzyme, partial [Kiritimatiellia bacterium]
RGGSWNNTANNSRVGNRNNNNPNNANNNIGFRACLPSAHQIQRTRIC